ncbi:enoyl-CoA hydratase/isomerase family protein [Limnohabitans sp. 2KL-51]|uniref:enoyl-CoA hydratase/isomerase family protein n=1 Tax=Limnohabitans sp. 2KL-51 TaxID=1977911 RepID=UPI000D36D3B2|nr:enoyl-CoA hydratase/isomerase family protein [Limnohabitans sp. 2KL-51]PUE44406.1 hypothetical protein B9Z49_19190 [Limnohabitans sp. 2KL-51]
MRDQPIRLEREGCVATLTLCCPELRNAVTREWIDALQTHADTLHMDESLRCVVVRSEGPMFCVGADVKAMASNLDNLPAYIQSLIQPAQAALLRLASLPVPIVGLLRGTAAGGGASFALACDILIAERSARMVFAYPQLGTTPDLGLSHALISRLGSIRALQLLLLTDTINMDDAERLGLVQKVIDEADVEDEVKALVLRLIRLPSTASKSLFMAGRIPELSTWLDRELNSFLVCSGTEEFRSRVKAFAKGHRG